MKKRILKAGDFDQRVTIQQPDTGQDSYGQPNTGWVDVGKVWAKKSDLTGREYMAASAAKAEVTTKIIIRYRPDVTAAMRVVLGIDVYNILSVLTQDNAVCTLMCSRGVNNG